MGTISSNPASNVDRNFHLQVSALEEDILEVDPETKEMLKMLVSHTTTTMRLD